MSKLSAESFFFFDKNKTKPQIVSPFADEFAGREIVPGGQPVPHTQRSGEQSQVPAVRNQTAARPLHIPVSSLLSFSF